MVHPNSKKIKKPSKFGELVTQKTQKQSKIVNSRNDLIKEYKSRNNRNSVEDRRFLRKKDREQKLLGNQERRNRKRMSFFNLDSDDENLNMTHKGINLDELDDFKDNEMGREFSDDENINAEMVNHLHFGGFEDEDGDKNDEGFQQRKKTKQEIYSELIHKSKKLKFHRQQQAMEDEQKIVELDEDFDEIFHLLSKNPEQHKENKRKKEKSDSYIEIQNQLAHDKRVRADAVNTREGEKKKKKDDEEIEEEEEDSGSEMGVEEEVKTSSKRIKKMRTELRNEKRSKKFYDLIDEIKQIKGRGKANEEDSFDEIDVESDEEDDEEGDFDEDDEEGGDEDGEGDDDLDEEDFE